MASSDKFLDILEKLVSFPSVTPSGEDAIKWVANFLSELGFKTDIQYFGPEDRAVCNLYACYNGSDLARNPFSTSNFNLCFAGHVDVVPPLSLEEWHRDPFVLSLSQDQDSEKIFAFGRGVVDMKGAIACFLAAIQAFLQKNRNFDGAISVLLTSDEEGDAIYGTKPMMEYIDKKYPKIDLCILGEPTSEHMIGDVVKTGRRGSVNFHLIVRGEQGHVAYPEKAKNPIYAMINMLDALKNEELDSGSKYFTKSHLEVTSIDVNNCVTNIIPGSISAKFNIRFNNLHSSDSIVQRIEQIICSQLPECFTYELQHRVGAEPFLQSYDPKIENFINIVQNISAVETKISNVGGTSDARFIHKYTKIVEFGLNNDQAHKINEHTQISDLQVLYNVYYMSLCKFLMSS